MRFTFLLLSLVVCSAYASLGATCSDAKHAGITAVVIDDDVDSNATVSLRWREKFMDAIFESARYCLLPKKSNSDVIVSVSAIDTDPTNFLADRAAVSTVAFFTRGGHFIGHQLQLCTPRTVDDCAKRALTQLDNQLMSLPEEFKPKD